MNIGTVSKKTLEKCLKDWVQCIRAFPSAEGAPGGTGVSQITILQLHQCSFGFPRLSSISRFHLRQCSGFLVCLPAHDSISVRVRVSSSASQLTIPSPSVSGFPRPALWSLASPPLLQVRQSDVTPPPLRHARAR